MKIAKKIAAIVFACLLTISIFAFVIPVAKAATFDLSLDAAYENTVVAYENSVKLTPDQQNLVPITTTIYVSLANAPGGTAVTTPGSVTLLENTTYSVKAPITANATHGGANWRALFQHWEVWDQDGTPELSWFSYKYKATYVGSFPGGYTRITKILPTSPFKQIPLRPEIEDNLEYQYVTLPKELLDRSDGLWWPYLRFTINNPVGGGNKKIIAVYYIGWGPETEHVYFKTIFGPDNQWDNITNNMVDVMTDILDPDYLGPIQPALGPVITSTPGFHMAYFGFNLRELWLGPYDGGGHGFSLRKAMAHLLPKDTLIATLFKYIVVRLESALPPSLGEWYEPGVTVYDYNPKAAYDSLVAGGWIYDPQLGTWRFGTLIAGGADCSIEILWPSLGAGHPFSSIVSRYVSELNGLRNPYTGEATPLKAHPARVDLDTLITRVFQYHAFEVFLGEVELSRIPDILYDSFHSANDYPGGDNFAGIHNNALDAQLAIVEFGLDHTAKVAAAKQSQIQLSNLLPSIPFYSKNNFDAHVRSSYGAVLEPGIGIDNFWTFVNIKGPRIDSDPWTPGLQQLFAPPVTQISGNVTIWTLSEAVESYNPAQAQSIYARTVLGNLYDSLMGDDPYSLMDTLWLAKNWNTVGPWTGTTPHGVSVTDGQYIEFTLDDRVVEGKVLWHDGEVFDASDILFTWKYIWDNQLTEFFGFWENLVDIHSPSPNKVVAYFDTTSQWLIYDSARTAAVFAPQVWGKIDTDNDGSNYLDQGDIEGDTSIRQYTPETHARGELGTYPALGAFPWLTQVIGTGPYVLYSTASDGTDSNLFAFDLRAHTTVMPTLHYWKTKGEILEKKIEYIYHMGDVTLDGSIDIGDLAAIGLRYGKVGFTPRPEPYGGYRQEDVVHDGRINILDVATAGKNYGKKIMY